MSPPRARETEVSREAMPRDLVVSREGRMGGRHLMSCRGHGLSYTRLRGVSCRTGARAATVETPEERPMPLPRAHETRASREAMP